MSNQPDFSKSGSEFAEQTCLFQWANSGDTRRAFPHFFDTPRDGETVGRCKMYSTNNNAGVADHSEAGKKTAAIRGARAKQIGLKPGVADIFLPLARHGCHGLFIELKIDPTHPENLRTGKKGQATKAKAGTVSPAQWAFGGSVQADGFGWAVAEGWQAAAAIIKAYLSD